MSKYEQLARMIELGVTQRDNGRGKLFTVLAKVWNGWAQNQAIIDICQDPVDKMAKDYLDYVYAGYPPPEWFQHLGDLG